MELGEFPAILEVNLRAKEATGQGRICDESHLAQQEGSGCDSDAEDHIHCCSVGGPETEITEDSRAFSCECQGHPRTMHDALSKSRNDLIFWTSNDQSVAQVQWRTNSCTVDNMNRYEQHQHCSTSLNMFLNLSEALAQHFQVTRRHWPLQLRF